MLLGENAFAEGLSQEKKGARMSLFKKEGEEMSDGDVSYKKKNGEDERLHQRGKGKKG